MKCQNYDLNQSDFLDTLNENLIYCLSDPFLDTQKLLRRIGMSRTDLHRKLSRTVGMSTTEYIRYVRLQRAAKLLIRKPNKNIWQIALEVGFDDQSYFARRFRELMGCCPMEWRKLHLEHM